MSVTIEADYVVIGAGAMGLAFTDELLTQTEATVALIDERGRPGGHWTDAYPFVRLHQPSSFYGVNSAELSSGHIDEAGWNAGLAELASGAEVCAYFDQVMNRRFLPSGRVAYHPSTRWTGDHAVSLPSGQTFEVHARRAMVDATYMKVSVPATHPPRFEVEPGVTVIPPNDLPRAARPGGGYVIVGAGKTAFDAILWLLSNHVEPAQIMWIVPRDSWLLNRAFVQPGEGFRLGEQLAVIAAADTPAEAFAGLEQAGHFLRIDQSVEPTMYRCATVSEAELEQLRRITNVIRKGRVSRITGTTIELEGGTVERAADTLCINCTADGLEPRPVIPVFADGRITLQALRGCQQVFSAALIAKIEALVVPATEKNRLAGVIPHPSTTRDYFTNGIEHIMNVVRWTENPELAAWLDDSRLSVGKSTDSNAPTPEMVMAAAVKIQQFLADWPEDDR